MFTALLFCISKKGRKKSGSCKYKPPAVFEIIYQEQTIPAFSVMRAVPALKENLWCGKAALHQRILIFDSVAREHIKPALQAQISFLPPHFIQVGTKTSLNRKVQEIVVQNHLTLTTDVQIIRKQKLTFRVCFYILSFVLFYSFNILHTLQRRGLH